MISSKLIPVALATAVAATALANSSWAGEPAPVFAAFTAVCVQPAADFAGVSKAAEANGWGATDAPSDEGMPGVTVADKLSKATTAGRAGLVLSAWTGATQKGVKVSDCAVHVAGTDFGALRAAAASWLAFAPAESTAKKAVFRFTEDAGAHRALTANEYDAAAGGAGLQILTVSGDANGTVLDLMMIKK